MEQLVLLLVIGAISFINWLIQRSAEHKQKRREGRMNVPAHGHEPPPLPGTEDDMPFGPNAQPPEELRRFFEALGIPIEESPPPPPPVEQRRVVQPLEEKPPPVPAPLSVPAPQLSEGPSRSTLVSEETRELAKRFADSDVTISSSTASSKGSMPDGPSLAEQLRSPEGLRRAMVLREILGPPRALNPL